MPRKVSQRDADAFADTTGLSADPRWVRVKDNRALRSLMRERPAVLLRTTARAGDSIRCAAAGFSGDLPRAAGISCDRLARRRTGGRRASHRYCNNAVGHQRADFVRATGCAPSTGAQCRFLEQPSSMEVRQRGRVAGDGWADAYVVEPARGSLGKVRSAWSVSHSTSTVVASS